ncbi:MAG: DNA polymerase Y family protein, partial [Rhizobiales bacterium]|nr:DNA polymerase Y family protein [Rhizobacter sp.]
ASRIADAQINPARARSAAGSLRPASAASRLVRPVWLFMQPEPLHEREASGGERGPWCDGQPLHLLSGPERIESGWWDFDPIERDYYIAQLPDGALVWIFRECVPGAGAMLNWFLQGRFG